MSGPDLSLVPVAPGQQWAIPKGGPWAGHYPPVTVTACADGWVRYGYAEVFTDERLPEAAFRAIYVPVHA
jgi:hypothetical protein